MNKFLHKNFSSQKLSKINIHHPSLQRLIVYFSNRRKTFPSFSRFALSIQTISLEQSESSPVECSAWEFFRRQNKISVEFFGEFCRRKSDLANENILNFR